jgi:hypothetical protein
MIDLLVAVAGCMSLGMTAYGLWNIPYLMHLNGHHAASGDDALVSHSGGTSVAANIVRGNVGHGAVG